MELWSRQIKKSSNSTGFHGIRRAPFQMTQVFHGIPWNIPWNSMELCCHQMTYHLVPWNSMEYSMEFQGILVPPNEVSLSSMEFHGTLRLSFYGMLRRELVCITVKWTWYNEREIYFHITSGRINTWKGVKQLKELFFLNLIFFLKYIFEIDKS